MGINYTNSREDIINFHMRHYKKTKIYKRIHNLLSVFITLLTLLIAIMVTLLLLYKNLYSRGDLLFLEIFIILYLIIILFQGKYYNFIFNLRLNKVYTYEKASSYFSKTKLTISEDYLNSLTDLARKSYSWKAIHDICLIDNYIFITTTSHDDILIPLSCFTSSEAINSFITTILQSTNLELKRTYPTNIEYS